MARSRCSISATAFSPSTTGAPHRGGPLADGIVAGASVVCPLHAWKINVEHGRVERPATAAACVATYPVRVERGVVFLGLPGDTAALPGRSKGEAA